MPDLKCGALMSTSHFPLLELKVILDLVATAFWVPHSPLCIYISRLRLQRKQGSFLVSHFTIRRRVATKNERVASNRPDKMAHQSIKEAVLEDNPLCNILIRFCVWLNSFNVEAVDWSIITSHVLLA